MHPPITKGKEAKMRCILNREAVYKEKDATPQQEKRRTIQSKTRCLMKENHLSTAKEILFYRLEKAVFLARNFNAITP